MRQRRIARVLLVCLLVLSMTGCDFEDVMLIEEILWEWSSAKNMNPRNEQGQIDPAGAARAAVEVGKRELTGSTGDDDADAALGIPGLTGEIRPWDKDVKAALAKGDETTINEAIYLFPNDHHYRNALAAVQLAKGDQAASEKTYDGALRTYRDTHTQAYLKNGDRVVVRDMVAQLEQALKNESAIGATDQGKQFLRRDYCGGAKRLKEQFGDSYWYERSLKSGFGCQ